MEAYVKSFATYRTIKKAPVISSAITVDSLDDETSTVTVVGTSIGRGDTGNWLIIDGCILLISNVKPQKDRTMLTLVSPLNAFSRPLELSGVADAGTIGGFIEAAITQHWIQETDPPYSLSYLSVSNSDTTPYVPPALDNGGCFSLSEYCRLMRKVYRVFVRFHDAGNSLGVSISCPPVVNRQVVFNDGRSQIQSVAYSKSGIAKLTVLHDRDTGEMDENGTAITVRERTTWYLSETGEISQQIPSRRAAGDWSTIVISGTADVESKVIETFAKNKANHKLEFWSDRDLAVQDNCTFVVYGEILKSHISYKRKSSVDGRFYYKSGELATTATEKLKGVLR